MKKTILALVLAFAIFVVAVIAANLDEGEKKERIHQHLVSQKYDENQESNTELASHLPLVIIDTNGKEIPGSVIDGVDDKYGHSTYTLAEDESDVIVAKIKIIDNEDYYNHLDDEASIESLVEIRKRGNSSRYFEKSQYALKLVDENGLDNNQSVMGMCAHSEWVLNGPYLDKSLVRNYIWYNISGEIMEWAPNVRYCEVVVNGSYEGLYLMVETITNGNNGCRLNISDNDDNRYVTGYILRADRSTEDDVWSIRDIYTFTERNMFFTDNISIRYPKRANLTDELRRRIELDFAEFEKSLYSYDYDTGDYGYWNYIDVDSFVDYYVVNVFSSNLDAGLFSTYIYKDMSGLYKMAVWDFNNAFDNYVEEETEIAGNDMFDDNLFFMLCKSEPFVEKIIERYEELRETYLNDEYLMNYIDEVIEYLGPAIERNYERWANAYAEDMLLPSERNVYTVKEAIEQLKDFIHERGEWLDEYLHTLRQYAHPSRNKTYNH